MNRKQMIDTIATARLTGSTHEQILDAILPQVTTVEELEALPIGTKLLDRDGEVWWRRSSSTTSWEGSGGRFGSSSADFAEIAGRFLRHQSPLTVVWQP